MGCALCGARPVEMEPPWVTSKRAMLVSWRCMNPSTRCCSAGYACLLAGLTCRNRLVLAEAVFVVVRHTSAPSPLARPCGVAGAWAAGVLDRARWALQALPRGRDLPRLRAL